jgi:tetratricopeptide (TPR) repeat protein
MGDAMRYDRHGFPIPPEFEPPATRSVDEAAFGRTSVGGPPPLPTQRQQPGAWKRWLLLAFIIGGVVPALLGPQILPAIRAAVVQWSLERADEAHARNDLPAAIADMNRALSWHGDDAELLCMRAMLRMEDRDAAGALDDAMRAAAIAPTAIQPWRVKALLHVVLGDPEAAVVAADMVISLSSPDDPDSLNHRAYIRALVGRDLEAGLADINRAMAAGNEDSPEMLDTRGFLLHLVGRHQEAVDQLNLAITRQQQNRRQLGRLAGQVDPVQLARRLRSLDQGMAVMLHHRALACREVGLEEQAKQDFELADRKGFDPSRGIF